MLCRSGRHPRTHLSRRRVGEHVIDGGLDYLVRGWTQTAAAVEGRHEIWMSEEWLHDLDGREIIQDLLDNVTESHMPSR